MGEALPLHLGGKVLARLHRVVRDDRGVARVRPEVGHVQYVAKHLVVQSDLAILSNLVGLLRWTVKGDPLRPILLDRHFARYDLKLIVEPAATLERIEELEQIDRPD